MRYRVQVPPEQFRVGVKETPELEGDRGTRYFYLPQLLAHLFPAQETTALI